MTAQPPPNFPELVGNLPERKRLELLPGLVPDADTALYTLAGT